MKIETEFDVGQKVYAVSNYEVYQIVIDSITIEVEEGNVGFQYFDKNWNVYDWVFKTKEEAEKKLKEILNGIK